MPVDNTMLRHKDVQYVLKVERELNLRPKFNTGFPLKFKKKSLGKKNKNLGNFIKKKLPARRR